MKRHKATTKIYTFPVRERHGERESDFSIEVRARSLESAIIEAVAEVVFGDADDYNTRRREARQLIRDVVGEEWTAESYFAVFAPAFWDGGDGCNSLFSIYSPSRVVAPSDTPQEMLRRAFSRYAEEGMTGHLVGRLEMVIDALSNDELERIFYEDLHAQGELEKEAA